MDYSLSQIAKIAKGTLKGSDNRCNTICYDSRMLSFASGVLFVALKGGRINGHSFIDELIGKGVVSFLVEKGFDSSTLPTNCGFVEVESPLLALQEVAKEHRQSYKGELVAICGSNGKSVIKEMLAQLFEGEGVLFRSPKSYNSQLGVALSLLMIEGSEDLVVIEAGISQIGEMEQLESIICPTTVLFTNIGAAHSQNFESQTQKIEQKALLGRRAAQIIYRKESCEAQILEQIYPSHQLFGVDTLEKIEHLPFADKASQENVAMAVATLKKVWPKGIDFDKKVAKLHRTPMRLELCRASRGSEIINDSYNSDYLSLEVALNYMQSIANGRDRIVILSDIYQSGEGDKQLYSKVATLLQNSGVEHFIAIGTRLNSCKELFKLKKQQFYLSTSEFLFENRTFHPSSKIILLKGSRVFGFERILRFLESKLHNNTLEVNLDNIIHNLDHYRSFLKPETKCMAMVKANSYGTGAFEVARALQKAHIDMLAVACADEGIELREGGITTPIVILGSDPSSYGAMIEYNLEPEIYSLKSLQEFISQCEREGIEGYPIHIKVESGMNRLGFSSQQIPELIEQLKSSRKVVVTSILSHLAASDSKYHQDFTNQQISRFKAICDQLTAPFSHPIIRHICNSAAIKTTPEAHFEMVRLGIGLYGCGDSNLKGVATLKTTITQIKKVKSGESIGYSRKGVADADITVAIIAIGYADGLRRALSCGGWSVEIGGVLAPIIGNICMDCCMVDITGIEAKEGDFVTVFGTKPTIEQMARELNTIEYEILTDISPRVKRTYVKEDN